MATTIVKPPDSTYTFSSQPKAVQQRKKYREQTTYPSDELGNYGNIMYDRRIIRGNTYALHTLPAHAQPDPIELQRQQEAKRRALARRKAREQLRTRTPEPVHGRKHIDVQTELYLEELSDRIEEADVEIQTDAFLDRPPSPLFIPQKTGKDITTQIETGDLFDFDLEVKPIIETLTGKTLEQALIEVAEEEELAEIREQQREYEEMRNAEIIELQRLEEQERRLRAEKERRMKQAQESLQLEQEIQQKIAARAFAKSYLQDLVPSVFNNLRENGYFYDPIEHEIELSFMPWLMDRTMRQVNQLVLGRTLLDSLIRDVVSKRTDDYEKLEDTLRKIIQGGVDMGTSTGDQLQSTNEYEQQPQQEQEQQQNESDINANAAQNERLFPRGYSAVEIRQVRTIADKSLPYSIPNTKRHSCRSRTFKQDDTNIIENNKAVLRTKLDSLINFCSEIFVDSDEKNDKLLSTNYISLHGQQLKWPRSICTLADGDLIVCEQEQCRILLFSKHLLLLSHFGSHGRGLYEFDHPWGVASLSNSDILIADTNNKRLQCFYLGFNSRFIHKYTLLFDEKPYFVSTDIKNRFVVSCDNGLLQCFTKKRSLISKIDLLKCFQMKSVTQPFSVCMDNSVGLFVGCNQTKCIYHMTFQCGILQKFIISDITGSNFIGVSQFIYNRNQLILLDTLNSLIYTLTVNPAAAEYDSIGVEEPLSNKIILKKSDNLNFPQSICLSPEGHLIVTECSINTRHSIKIYRFYDCKCHTRSTTTFNSSTRSLSNEQ
ncbi:unnamed protein product [Didymodactylos carnosus]|nr:unnamed protein product [Didymodactylos carnosus]CAF3885252.1 unnamed protein product [Didymodactylos carnosus]